MAVFESFKPAAWRGTTSADGKVIGISLDLPDGSVARYVLDLQSAKNLAESILDFLGPYLVRTNVQSDSSSGNPNVEGSPQEGQSQ